MTGEVEWMKFRRQANEKLVHKLTHFSCVKSHGASFCFFMWLCVCVVAECVVELVSWLVCVLSHGKQMEKWVKSMQIAPQPEEKLVICLLVSRFVVQLSVILCVRMSVIWFNSSYKRWQSLHWPRHVPVHPRCHSSHLKASLSLSLSLSLSSLRDES